jgi:hypothetical protein
MWEFVIRFYILCKKVTIWRSFCERLFGPHLLNQVSGYMVNVRVCNMILYHVMRL